MPLRTISYKAARTMTRITLLSLLLCAVASLTSGTVFSAADKELKIAIVLWRGETESERGFKEELKELGYSVEYTALNAEQNRTKLGHILREELQPRLKEFDYIYTWGTTVTKAAKQIVDNQVPQIFAMVFDPIRAGDAGRDRTPPRFGIVAVATAAAPRQPSPAFLRVRPPINSMPRARIGGMNATEPT